MWIVIFFGLQFIIIGGIVFFLKRSLHNNLVEITVQRFETLFSTEISSELIEIVVVVKDDLSQRFKERITSSAQRKLGRPVDLIVVKDPGIKGGIVIKAGKLILDGSLIHRLKASGMFKGV